MRRGDILILVKGLNLGRAGKAARKAASPFSLNRLKVETHLGRVGSRRNEMGSTESREEVVERDLVGQIDNREAQAPLIAISVEEIVFAHRHIKQIPRFDSRWIQIIVFLAWSRNVD